MTASEEHVRRIEDIIRQLKSERARPQERRLQIVTLKHLQVDSALASLTNLVNERMSDKRFEDSPKPLLLSDAANNRLLITATDDQFKEITGVIAALDVGAEKGQREMRVLPGPIQVRE